MYRQTLYQRYYKFLWGSIAVLIFIAGWEIITTARLVNPLALSSPSKIALAGATMIKDGQLWEDLKATGYSFAIGFLLSAVAGIIIGILTGWYKFADAILGPFISAMYATPRVALLPLIIIWFGIGIQSKLVLVFLSAIFPIIVNTDAAIKTLDANLLKVAKSFGAQDWDIFKEIALPASLPFILAGLRLAVGRGLVGVVVGEMYAATKGIGYLISVAGGTMQMDKMFVGVIIIATIGVACTEGLKSIEKRFDVWRIQ